MRTKYPRPTTSRCLLAAVALAVWPGACGYSTTSRTAKDIKTIHVPFFENKTTQPNLELTVTENIIDNLVNDNTLKVVPEDQADAVLDGTIAEFTNKPFSFNKDLNAEEYIVEIHVVVSLFNRKTNQPIWKNHAILGNGSYFIEQFENSRTFDDAVDESLKEITDQILNLTVQDW